MDEQAKNLDGFILAERLPISEPVWVLCDGYRCLAFLGLDGKWRAYSTGKELTEFVKECPVQNGEMLHHQDEAG